MDVDYDIIRWKQVVTSNAVADIRLALDMFEKAMYCDDYESAIERLDTIASVVTLYRQSIIEFNDPRR